MAIVCLGTLASLYSRYYSYNFTTKITRERKQQIRFPSTTICNRNKFDVSQGNLNAAELKYLRHNGDLEDIYPPIDWDGKEGAELNKMDYVKFWERGAYKAVDMFKGAYFKGQPFNVMGLKYSQKQDQRCFTFNGGDFVSENIGLILAIDVMQGTYLDGGVYEAGVTITYLPHPYNTRGMDCVNTKASDFVNPLEWFKEYSIEGCLQECSNKAAMDACNCTAGWEPHQARIGGQIGLFLGASILTIVELLELLAACLLTSFVSLWTRHKLKGSRT
ncbi:acid-sensing ion channel 1-like [Haliotis asinina]|uniref:acid-sensing ion channel 1-like n=1 Tax=Haliotis asinina TaxID=109174 RepID=UPI003531CBD0